MDEYQNILHSFLKDIVFGHEMRPGLPVIFLVNALKACKNQNEKELAKEVYQQANELLILESSFEIACSSRKSNRERRKEIRCWFAEKLKKLENECPTD